jgi:hypothetical protein
MSVAEVAAVLQTALIAIEEQRQPLAATIKDLRRTRGQFHALTANSGHHLVGETLRQHTAAAERLREADRLLAGAPVALAEFATAIGATLRPAAMPAGQPPRPPAGTDAPAKSPPGPRPPVPVAVIRLAGRLAPWRDGEDAKGYAHDVDRRHLDDASFVSGRVKSAAHGLRPVRGGGLPVTVTDHVEGHVAARMRAENGPRDVTLVINKTPCDDRPFGCHQLLPHIIPAGSRLTVYVEAFSKLHLRS